MAFAIGTGGSAGAYFRPSGGPMPAPVRPVTPYIRPFGPGEAGMGYPQITAPVAPAAPTFTAGAGPAATPVFSGGGGGGGGGGSASADYSSDPILAKVTALANQQIADAQAQAIAAEKTNLIRYGDPTLVQKVLGKKAGDTAKAASSNPYSTVAELGRWNTRADVNIDETRNRQNLFYSSTRARDRQLQGEDYLRQQSKTAGELQDVLTQIATNLLAAKRAAQMTIMQAEEAAYNRALQMAMQNAYAGAYYSGGGGGGGGGYDSGGGGGSPAAAVSGAGLQDVKASLGYGSSQPWTAGL